jgi:hypothetical protein
VNVRTVLLVALAIAACDKPATDAGVRTLALPEIEPAMPDGPGKNDFVASCRTCHSPRYILNQPRFPRKTWVAEVDKMKSAYGAPIPPEMAGAIVDYLVAIRGTPE